MWSCLEYVHSLGTLAAISQSQGRQSAGDKRAPGLDNNVRSSRACFGMLTSRRLTNRHNSIHLYYLNLRLAKDIVYGAKFKSEEFFSLNFLKTNFVLRKTNKRKTNGRDHVWSPNLKSLPHYSSQKTFACFNLNHLWVHCILQLIAFYISTKSFIL